MSDGNENKDREDLTDETSQSRLLEYREKGIVSQSKELSGLLVLLATGIATYTMMSKFSFEISDFMKTSLRADIILNNRTNFLELVKKNIFQFLSVFSVIFLPVGFTGFFVGMIASIIQIGFIFSFDPITPDFKKINPLSGFKRLFSLRQLLEVVRIILKIAIIVWVSFLLIQSEVLSSIRYFSGESGFFLFEYKRLTKLVFFGLILVFTIFSLSDFLLQKYEYRKKLKMTKQELKQEHKEREGDPQIRARIRSVQREMARKRMMQAVKKADVLITNPTHIAVALVYNKVKMSAPRVVAKGADLVAQQMKKIAQQAEVPMVENVPLARTLFKSVKIGQVIPKSLYQAVAEVLAYVYRLKKRDL